MRDAHTSTVRVELMYRDTPPSLNTAGTRGSHWTANRLKKRWQSIWEALLMTSQLPRNLEHVSATAMLRFPVARRRDVDNHTWLLCKALGDALVNGDWIPDDTPEHFTFRGLEFDRERGPRRTLIRLEGRR